MTSILTHLHNNNPPVIIRDIKPANIITTEAGNLYFIDFTIARYAVKDKEDTVRMGSPGLCSSRAVQRPLNTAGLISIRWASPFISCLTGHDPLKLSLHAAACVLSEIISLL